MSEHLIENEQAMLAFGAKLAKEVLSLADKHVVMIYLIGDLGAGKTTLTRGFLRGLGYDDKVKSPTYTLLESYEIGEYTVVHMDLYRIADPEELEYLGIRDYLQPKTIFLVEWPERGQNFLPPADVTCNIDALGDKRRIRLNN